MPRIPKKNPRSGSVLLGRELRRLRGTRRMRDICNLTVSPGLTGRVAPIAMATLSELESGKALPQLHTLHSLSIVYKVSMSQLMAYVLEEKLAARSDEMQVEGAALTGMFAERLSASKWDEALQVALIGEHQAQTEAARIAWRSNRASCLMRLGLGQEALELLTDCCESAVPDAEQRFYLFKTLAACHADAGDVTIGEIMAREARAVADGAGLTPDATLHLDFLRLQMVILKQDAGHEVSERVIREHLRLADDIERRWDATDAPNLHRIRICKSRLLFRLGNTLVAARDAENALAAARELGNADVTAHALETLALIRIAQNDRDGASALLDQARQICETNEVHDRLFDVNFRLYLLLREERPGRATASYRRCEELFPMLSSRTALARQFEALARKRG